MRSLRTSRWSPRPPAASWNSLSENTCPDLAARLLDLCLRGERPPAGLLCEVARECSADFFRVVVEGLADRFEPALCDAYADLMSEALACVDPAFRPADLAARYRRVRLPRRCEIDPAAVCVLSR